MFHSRCLNNKINSTHEGALRITYQDNASTFQELWNKDNCFNTLHRNNTFEICQVHSVYHGTESLSFLGPKIWDLAPVEFRQSDSLDSFKLKTKNWVSFECPCRLCKTYIQQVGFLTVWSLTLIDIFYVIFLMRYMVIINYHFGKNCFSN